MFSSSASVCLLVIALVSFSETARLRSSSGPRHANHLNTGRRGLCAPTALCCQGKDNRCRAPVPGSVKESVADSDNRTESAGCFCDAACLDLGDCCDDYTEICKSVDCVLADEWDEYGECDSRCGPGIRQRRRRVIQHPMNGGQPCGKTVERIPCEGTNCKVARAPVFEEMRETGYIIPAVYGSWRKSKRYDPFSDIRRNLFEHYDSKSLVKRPSYCTVFELTEVRAACTLTSSSVGANSTMDWTNQLVKGRQVCVECQPAVMKKKLGGRCRGNGVQAKETRWDAVTVPGCRGRWVMKSRQEECQCSGDDKQLASFILV